MTDGNRPAEDQTMETVAVYPSITEASIVRGRLDQAGIRSWLQEELTAGQPFYFGAGSAGIKLQVASGDLQQVRELIADEGKTGPDSNAPPWTCPRCGNEVDGGFEICWSCQAAREQHPEPGSSPPPTGR